MSLADLTNIPSPSIWAYIITFVIALLAMPILFIFGLLFSGGGDFSSMSDKWFAIFLIVFVLGGSIFGTYGYHAINKESKKLVNIEQALQEDYGLTFSDAQKKSDATSWTFNRMISGQERMATNQAGKSVIMKIVQEVDGDTLTPYVNGQIAPVE